MKRSSDITSYLVRELESLAGICMTERHELEEDVDWFPLTTLPQVVLMAGTEGVLEFSAKSLEYFVSAPLYFFENLGYFFRNKEPNPSNFTYINNDFQALHRLINKKL